MMLLGGAISPSEGTPLSRSGKGAMSEREGEMGSKKVADVFQKTGEIHKKDSNAGGVILGVIAFVVLLAIVM